MINRVVLVGRLTRNPELKNLSNDTSLTNFSIALNRRYSREEKTDFIHCVAWNKTAELITQYLTKGSLVGIDGRLQQDKYQAQDGTNRSKVIVVCENVQFLESRPTTSQNKKENEASSTKLNEANKEKAKTTVDVTDEDLPW